MKTLAIIGASYLQLPLVRKAKEMGLRTICFAWTEGAVCKDVADKFYPISVTDKEAILKVCLEEKIDGITSIASDVAVPTIAYVAANMGLIGNTEESAAKSSNKFLMRKVFTTANVPCPAFAVVESVGNLKAIEGRLVFPLIAKPVDRSGSAGVMECHDYAQLESAVNSAIACSFSKRAIVEQCITGMHEISVEGISWNGEYHLLQMTDKITTGAPHYVELGHHQPSQISPELKVKVEEIVRKGVAALDIRYGASHSELMIQEDGSVYMTEIGARMGGDFIGSDLVKLSTGYDFLRGVIEVALGDFTGIDIAEHSKFSGVWFYAPETQWVKNEILNAPKNPSIVASELQREDVVELTRSADRSGYFIYASNVGRIEHV